MTASDLPGSTTPRADMAATNVAAPRVTMSSIEAPEPNLLDLQTSTSHAIMVDTNVSPPKPALPSEQSQTTIVTATATAATPTLFGLPRELRDQIYGEVLVSESPVQLSTQERHIEPNFLRVNRQIREEAIEIYYNQNKFNYTVCTWDNLNINPFLEKRAKYKGTKKPDRITVSFCRCNNCKVADVNRRRLEKWFKAVHQAPATFPYPVLTMRAEGPKSEQDVLEDTITSVFSSVAAAKDYPWEEVQTMLRSLNMTITVLEANKEDIVDVVAGRPVPLRMPRFGSWGAYLQDTLMAIGAFVVLMAFACATVELAVFLFGVKDADGKVVGFTPIGQVLLGMLILFELAGTIRLTPAVGRTERLVTLGILALACAICTVYLVCFG